MVLLFFWFFTFFSRILTKEQTCIRKAISSSSRDCFPDAGSFILGRRRAGKILSMLACPDGGPRVCGHAHANICAGYLLMRFNCWRAPTVLQRFAGRSTPTRSCPSLRKECLPYTKGNPREKSEEPYYLDPCIEMCTYGKL